MKINDYMDAIGKETDKTKKDEMLLKFYNQYLLMRINKANVLLYDGKVFNVEEQSAYDKLLELAERYEAYFNN